MEGQLYYSDCESEPYPRGVALVGKIVRGSVDEKIVLKGYGDFVVFQTTQNSSFSFGLGNLELWRVIRDEGIESNILVFGAVYCLMNDGLEIVYRLPDTGNEEPEIYTIINIGDFSQNERYNSFNIFIGGVRYFAVWGENEEYADSVLDQMLEELVKLN